MRHYLKEEIFVDIQNRHICGFNAIQLLRREAGGGDEFVMTLTIDSP